MVNKHTRREVEKKSTRKIQIKDKEKKEVRSGAMDSAVAAVHELANAADDIQSSFAHVRSAGRKGRKAFKPVSNAGHAMRKAIGM